MGAVNETLVVARGLLGLDGLWTAASARSS